MTPGPSVNLATWSGPVRPGSIAWRIGSEGALLLGGGRALILQVAHPAVAAGVAQHSNYREAPWRRLYRTLEATTRIVFGDERSSAEAAAALRRVHERISGRDDRGRRYRATDPELLLWVHATLIDTSLLIYDRYVRPPAWPALEAIRLVTIGTLPASVREELGLAWGPLRERLLGPSQGTIRRLLPLLPSLLRQFPAARRAA